MTAKVLNKLNMKQRSAVEHYKRTYKNASSPILAAEMRTCCRAYVQGLADAGFLTEMEARLLFVYSTV